MRGLLKAIRIVWYIRRRTRGLTPEQRLNVLRAVRAELKNRKEQAA